MLRYGVAVLVALLVTGGVLLVSSVLLTRTEDAPTAATSPSPSPSPSAPTATATPSPSPTVTRKPRLTAPKMTRFVRRYLATATDDQAAGWRLLTPPFQRESGGFGAYTSFWAPVGTARASGITADARSGRVGYRVRYTYPDGHVFLDRTRLLLRLTPGGIRIAGEG